MKFTMRLILAAGGLGMVLCANALELKPNGRLHLDYAAHHADAAPLSDRAIVRRARLGVDGKLGHDWSFEASYEFTDADGGIFRDGIDDLSVRYEGWPMAELVVGQFKVPFGMEALSSSNNLIFIERALPSDAFAPSDRLGAGMGHRRDRYTLTGMAFGSSISGNDRGRGLAARATFAPILEGSTVLHVGAAAAIERPRGDIRLRARPESRPSDIRFVNTGWLGDADRIDRLGLEAAWKSGPLLASAEWMRAMVRRDAGEPDLHFGGWSVAGSWVLTGESHEYKKGVFKGLPISRPGGAWELTARFSHVDLDDGKVQGGKERNITLGLNYHVNRHLRIMTNYIKVHSERRGKADDPRILLVRAQLTF